MTKLTRAALIVAFFFGLEKALGFLGKIIVNRQFGLSATLDAFYAANNIPALLVALISGGVLAMAFIPVLSEYLERRGQLTGKKITIIVSQHRGKAVLRISPIAPPAQ